MCMQTPTFWWLMVMITSRHSNQLLFQILLKHYCIIAWVVLYQICSFCKLCWFFCAAVAEENLLAPDQPDMVRRSLPLFCPFCLSIFWTFVLFYVNLISSVLLLTSCRVDSIIPIYPSYSMGWMQLVISSQSGNCARSTIGRDMKYPLIHSMRSMEAMLRQMPAFSNRPCIIY